MKKKYKHQDYVKEGNNCNNKAHQLASNYPAASVQQFSGIQAIKT